MGCGCLLVLLAMFSPRLAFILVWLFTDLVGTAFDSFVLPLIGLVFLPFTTLFYVLVYEPTGLSAWGWLLLIFGFLLDLGTYAGGYGSRDRSSDFSSA